MCTRGWSRRVAPYRFRCTQPSFTRRCGRLGCSSLCAGWRRDPGRSGCRGASSSPRWWAMQSDAGLWRSSAVTLVEASSGRRRARRCSRCSWLALLASSCGARRLAVASLAGFVLWAQVAWPGMAHAEGEATPPGSQVAAPAGGQPGLTHADSETGQSGVEPAERGGLDLELGLLHRRRPRSRRACQHGVARAGPDSGRARRSLRPEPGLMSIIPEGVRTSSTVAHSDLLESGGESPSARRREPCRAADCVRPTPQLNRGCFFC